MVKKTKPVRPGTGPQGGLVISRKSPILKTSEEPARTE